MSLKSSKLSDNSKKSVIISRRTLTWIEHAEKHFASGSKYLNGECIIVDDISEYLMYLTNPAKPDDFSFLQCAKDFHNSKDTYKIPQTTLKQRVGSFGFLFEYTSNPSDWTTFSSGMNEFENNKRIETITYFLLLNAAIEGEI